MSQSPVKVRAGGSFAPPLDDAKLDAYEALLQGEGKLGDRRDPCHSYFAQLVKMIRKFRETPKSTEPGEAHPANPRAMVIPLTETEQERIWDEVPWEDEIKVWGEAFDALGEPERTPAFHLLWFAQELTRDREPITCDTL